MFDYYSQLQNMSQEKLSNEIEKLTKKLLMISQTSPMYEQILGMLDMAQGVYSENIMVSTIKKEDAVIDIGEIESTVQEHDYTQEELLIAVVQEYTKDTGNNNK